MDKIEVEKIEMDKIELAAGTALNVVNDSDTRLLFSNFNAGDNFIPFDTTWIDPHSTGELKVGNFKSLGIGVQVQNGGVWIGGDPKEPPYAYPGQTVTLTITKKYS